MCSSDLTCQQGARKFSGGEVNHMAKVPLSEEKDFLCAPLGQVNPFVSGQNF